MPKGAIEKKTITPTDIKRMYNSGSIKFVMLPNSKFSPDEIDFQMKLGKIIERYENIQFLPESEFKKLKMGSKKASGRKTRLKS